jgi:hypothetical protein
MRKILTNTILETRKETLNGREFLVAPITLLVPGILNGSHGPLLYPPEEVQNSVKKWCGVPIVVYHPTYNGEPISARTPQGAVNTVGVLYNCVYNGKLIAEGWFDVELLRRTDIRVYEAIINKNKVEVSTGLYTKNVINENYEYPVATSFEPDHLAILPDQIGACSVEDGCGVNNSKGNKMNKNTLIDKLIANSCCWEEEDRTVLSSLKLEKLKRLVKNEEEKEDEEKDEEKEIDKEVENEEEKEVKDEEVKDEEKEVMDNEEVKEDEKKDEEKEVMDNEEVKEEEDVEEKEEEKKVDNRLTADEKADIEFARNMKKDIRNKAISTIMSLKKNKFNLDELNKMDVNLLVNMAALVEVEADAITANYEGQSVFARLAPEDRNDILPLPKM